MRRVWQLGGLNGPLEAWNDRYERFLFAQTASREKATPDAHQRARKAVVDTFFDRQYIPPTCSRCWYSGMNGKPGTFARNPRKEAGVVSDGATLSVPGIAAAGGMAVWMCPVSGFASAGFGAGSRAFGRSAGNVTDNTFDSEPAVKDSDSVESVEAHGQGAGVEIYRPASHGLPAGECGKHSPGASAAER